MRYASARGVILVLALVLAVMSCGPRENGKLCCNEEYPDPNSTERNYCGDVAMVAGDYIFEPGSVPERKVRQDEVAAFLAKLEHCDDVECIRTTADTTATADGFDDMFLSRLDRSDARETIAQNEKPDAIKCGLRHAIDTDLQ